MISDIIIAIVEIKKDGVTESASIKQLENYMRMSAPKSRTTYIDGFLIAGDRTAHYQLNSGDIDAEPHLIAEYDTDSTELIRVLHGIARENWN